MRAVFSSLFKQDLLDAETRYYSISERLGSDLHERVKNAVRPSSVGKVVTTSDHTAFRVNTAALFPTTFTTRSKVTPFTSLVSCMKLDILLSSVIAKPLDAKHEDGGASYNCLGNEMDSVPVEMIVPSLLAGVEKRGDRIGLRIIFTLGPSSL